MASAAGSGDAKPDITLYWLDHSRAQRIVWLLEELQLPYKLEPFRRNSTRLAPPEAKKIHPLGKFPMLSLDGRVLAESGVIIEVLLSKFGPQFLPSSFPSATSDTKDEAEEDRLRYLHFMHYSEGSLMPPLLVSIVTQSIREAPVPFFVRPIAKVIASKVEDNYSNPTLETHLSWVEKELEGRTWLVGETLSGADFMMWFSLQTAMRRVKWATAEKYPNISAYVKRVEERDAFQRAKKKTEELEKPSS